MEQKKRKGSDFLDPNINEWPFYEKSDFITLKLQDEAQKHNVEKYK